MGGGKVPLTLVLTVVPMCLRKGGREGEIYFLGIGDAVDDVIHLQFFLELGLGSAMATMSDVGVVCIQNPPNHM